MVMRISTSMLYNTATSQMNTLQSALNKTQLQLSSGDKNLSPADDPVATSRALEVTQSQSINTQLVTNRDSAKNYLSQEDVALVAARDTVSSVQTIVVNAGNATLTDTDRASLAVEVQSALDSLVGTANTADGQGGYLFSGYKSTTVPYSQSATGATYQGDQGVRTLQVGSNRTIPVSTPGSTVFDSNLTGNGSFVVAADPGNVTRGGTGIFDPGTVTDQSALTGDNYTINFAVTPADPTTNAAAVTTYTVTDTTTGATVLPAAPATDPIPYVSGQSIAFDGQQTSVTGVPADGDSFTVAPSTNQSVFTTLSNLLATLKAPSSGAAGQAALTNGLTAASLGLATASNNIMSVDSAVGSSQNELDSLDSTGDSLGLQYSTTLSNLQDLDTVSAISTFTQQQTQLQAAQKSFTQISGLSLFNYINT